MVAASVGGLKHLIDHGRTGMLIEGWNPQDYKKAVAGLLENPIMATEIAMNAAEKAKEYSWGKTAENLIDIYTSILEKTLVDCR